MNPLRSKLIDVISEKGLRHLPEPVRLSSGEMSHDFIDGKEALAAYDDLELAARAIVEAVHARNIAFDAVGGLTLGADALAVAIAAVERCRWFIIRKAPKNRGTNRLIEGDQLADAPRVLLVDDVITTGGSILQALDAVQQTGATVVAAATLVDRSDRATVRFDELGIPYFPMATYADLGIDPVGAAASG